MCKELDSSPLQLHLKATAGHSEICDQPQTISVQLCAALRRLIKLSHALKQPPPATPRTTSPSIARQP